MSELGNFSPNGGQYKEATLSLLQLSWRSHLGRSKIEKRVFDYSVSFHFLAPIIFRNQCIEHCKRYRIVTYKNCSLYSLIGVYKSRYKSYGDMNGDLGDVF